MHTSMFFTIDQEGPVATLWLDAPERRNAMGPDFWADLPRLIDDLGGDPSVRVVIIAAKGPHFTVGLDLKAMNPNDDANGVAASPPSDNAVRASAFLQHVKRLQHSISAVAACPKPVIAAIHGACIGGGVDLITACDVRLASADAYFSIRETRIAVVADVGTLQRLPSIIGKGHVAELALTGKDVDAHRAEQIGLVNGVFPDVDALMAHAREMATEIAANSPLAVQGTKAVLRACEHRTVEEGLDYVAVWNAAFMASDDLAEAMAAFKEKRTPTFADR